MSSSSLSFASTSSTAPAQASAPTSDSAPASAFTAHTVKKKKLTEIEKYAIVARANLYRDPATLEFVPGGSKIMSDLFKLNRHTIRTICNEYDLKAASMIENGEVPVVSLGQKYIGNNGPKSKFTDEVKMNIIELHNKCVREGRLVAGVEFTRIFNEQYGTDFHCSSMKIYTTAIGLDVFNGNSVELRRKRLLGVKKRKRMDAAADSADAPVAAAAGGGEFGSGFEI